MLAELCGDIWGPTSNTEEYLRFTQTATSPITILQHLQHLAHLLPTVHRVVLYHSRIEGILNILGISNPWSRPLLGCSRERRTCLYT